jgi:NAD(P)-dependent dehydrogenase (short-subunit alcohol dehydrogenase family)
VDVSLEATSHERILDGRVAVVTGAGQGVGEGIARALARRGATVVVAARRAVTGEPVAEAIRAGGDVAECIVTDVTERASVEACVATTVEHHGRLDVVVHNAFAGGVATPLQDTPSESWRQMSYTSAWGSFWCAQAAFAHLRASDQGRLVLLTSPSALEGSANIPLYSPAKAAQRAMAKSLAREWGPHGITVNCIAPVADSPALAGAFDQVPELRGNMEARTPLGRIGDPVTDIGGVAAFLAGPDSGYVTGQTIVCDGGSFLGL